VSEYLVLARKYRSATFEEVVGQEHIARTLTAAIEAGRVAHAFLFAGTRGVGKTTMARILAKALCCLSSDGPTTTPCNECDACRAIARGDDVDVMEIDGASNRKIEHIRELRSNAIYRPSRCRYKVYYIDEVHMLVKEAFNALLKTLEEPPPHVKFIFSTTDPEELPATVLSRCQRFDFRNIPTRRIAEHLSSICESESVDVDEAAIFRIARAAAGSMRDGLSLLDQLLSAGGGRITEEDVVSVLGTPSEERTEAVVSAVAEGDPAAALAALDDLLASGVSLESAVRALAEAFREMMLAAACGSDSELIELPEAQRQRLADLAGKFALPALVQAVSVCQTTARGLRGLTSPRGLVEAAVVRLAAAEKFADAASLVERLEALSGGYRSEKKKMTPPAPAAARPAPAGNCGGGRREPLPPAGSTSNSRETGRPAPAPDRKPASPPAQPPTAGQAAAEPSAGEQPPEQARAADAGGKAPVTLSTAERTELARDPAVQPLLNLFGGSIEHVRAEAPPTASADACDEETIDPPPDEE
jgi:DNA polymerase-3 subunit gamma/tau